MAVEMDDQDLLLATENIQRNIAAGNTDSALDHLGEAASIALLQSAGKGRLISDDHGARSETRLRGVNASSTVGVIAKLLAVAGSGVDTAMADMYLQTLRTRQRMHAQLTSTDLLAGDLGPGSRLRAETEDHVGGPLPDTPAASAAITPPIYSHYRASLLSVRDHPNPNESAKPITPDVHYRLKRWLPTVFWVVIRRSRVAVRR